MRQFNRLDRPHAIAKINSVAVGQQKRQLVNKKYQFSVLAQGRGSA